MRLCFITVGALLIGAAAAHAQDWPRFEAIVGGQVADFQTDVKLDATATVAGTPVNFEGDVGFNENAGTAWAGALWRISRRNQVEVDWTRAQRTVVQRELQRDIRFGGETFGAGVDVNASLDSWIIGGAYRFAIVSTPVVELGPLLGVMAVNLSTGMELSGFVPGLEDDTSEDVERDATVTAPAVLPGAFVSLRAHPRLKIRARGGYISADFGNIDGQIFMAQTGADFRISRWFGVGGSYSYNRLSVAVDESEFRGEIRYTFSGPQIYAIFTF